VGVTLSVDTSQGDLHCLVSSDQEVTVLSGYLACVRYTKHGVVRVQVLEAVFWLLREGVEVQAVLVVRDEVRKLVLRSDSDVVGAEDALSYGVFGV